MNAEQIKEALGICGVHPVLGSTGVKDWNIEQNPDELAAFLTQIPDVKTVLELGTGYRAGLARFMAEYLHWQVTSVDMNRAAEHPALQPGSTHQFIQGTTTAFYEELERLQSDRTWDLVIIDADHAFAAVRADFEHFAARATKVVMFHDIAGDRGCEGAAAYWKATAYLKGKLKKGYFEAIAEGPQRAGIGWWVK